MASSRQTQLEAELQGRLEKLLQGDRLRLEPLPVEAVAFHRLPRENFDPDGRLVECGVRTPDQSVTVGPYGDEYDALLEIAEDGSVGGFKVEWGVVFITHVQLQGVVAVVEATKGTPRVVFGANLSHDPYKANYAHGNILSTRDGEPKAWPSGAKKTLRKTMAGHMGKQIILAPEGPAAVAEPKSLEDRAQKKASGAPDSSPESASATGPEGRLDSAQPRAVASQHRPDPEPVVPSPGPAAPPDPQPVLKPTGVLRRFASWIGRLLG